MNRELAKNIAHVHLHCKQNGKKITTTNYVDIK